MPTADAIILDLIATGRQATADELEAIIAHVAQAPFATYLAGVPRQLRNDLTQMGITITATRLPSVEQHLLKRVYVERQWPTGTTVAQYVLDLHQAVAHPDVQIWTYRLAGHSYAGFLAPSHIQNVPKPEPYIFVAYNPAFGTITTGHQASGPTAVFAPHFSSIVKHK